MHGAEHESSPGAPYQVRISRSMTRMPIVADALLPRVISVVQQGPEDRRRVQQPEQDPAQPERHEPNIKMKSVASNDRNRDDDHVDQERENPARQHALEQFADCWPGS